MRLTTVLFLAIGAFAVDGLQTNTATMRMPPTTYAPIGSTAGPPATQPPATSSCACTYKNIWLDIYFLVDTSSAMEAHGLQEAQDFLLAVVAKMTIGQALGQVSRVGFITYSDQATIQSNLTQWQSTDDILSNMPDLPYDGGKGTNIEAAVKLANQQFSSSGHRPNTKSIIVVLASAFKSGDYNDPTQACAVFKGDGGTIITIEYVQSHSSPVPFLSSCASTGYTLTNNGVQLQANNVRDLFCKANCFCAKDYIPFDQDSVYHTPSGGCYNPVTISTLQSLATRYCTQHRNSALISIKSDAKQNFIATTSSDVFPARSKFWIGLKYTNGQWVWPDGSAATYTQWAPGQPNLSSGNCAYMTQTTGFKFGWFADDCTDDWTYICQALPCDTDHYCDNSD